MELGLTATQREAANDDGASAGERAYTFGWRLGFEPVGPVRMGLEFTATRREGGERRWLRADAARHAPVVGVRRCAPLRGLRGPAPALSDGAGRVSCARVTFHSTLPTI